MKSIEERILELYCKDLITEEEVKDRLKSERKKGIERYLDLFLEGHITREQLIDALCE
jgi:hypothetical protein